MSSVPSVPTAWQADFKKELPYYERFFRYRFRYLNAEQREEQVQEAICQAAIITESEWRHHDNRVSTRFDVARRVTGRVKHGRSCTRGFKNADPLDRTYRKTGPKREQCRHTVHSALNAAVARPGPPIETAIDLQTWFAKLPPAQREIARDLLAGVALEDIASRHDVHVNTVRRWRRALADSFAALSK